ncbi:MAG TPA: nickel-binding protein [Puia sp.]|nr:nickel-binding protein [Puia sp.]
MPIFMDRHDVSETVTAENVAQIHQEDLKIQDEFGCRGLTYWFDDKRKTAFCLIEAPDAKAIQKMHDKAHGQAPHSIIEVEASIVESFLGRIQDPEKARNTGLNIIDDPAFRTIMVISLSQMTLNRDSQPFKVLFEKLNQDIRKALQSHEGNIVRQSDDYYLVSFKSVTKAVHAALEIQQMNKEFMKNEKKEKVNIKIGLSAGVPVTEKQLIFEDTIKLAERIAALVKGEIIVSAEVKELYKSENANTFIKGRGITSILESDEKFITLLMDYTDKVWNDANLKVDHFCKPLGRSKSQLYRKMILLTGQSPNTFIKDYRLKEALKFIQKRVGNISEIAFTTGFSSPSYFTKCFKKKFGLIPADYLNSLR